MGKLFIPLVFLFLVVTTVLSNDNENYSDRSFVETGTTFKSIAGFVGVGEHLYLCDLGAQNVKRTSLLGNEEVVHFPSQLAGGMKSFCDDLDVSPDGKKLALADTNGNITIVDIETKVGVKINNGPDQTCTFCGPSPISLSGLFGINHIQYSPSGKLYTSSFIGFNAIRLVDEVNNPVNYILTSIFGAPDFTTNLNNFVFIDENTIIAPSPNTGRVLRLVLNHSAKTATIAAVEITGLLYPVATDVDSDGNIYVADRSTGKIHRKDLDGKITVIAQLSLGLDNVWMSDDQTHLYVSGNNNDLWRIRISNNNVGVLISSDVSNPGGIAYDSDKLYVANDWDIRVFDEQGNLINSVHTSQRPAGPLLGLSTVNSISINGNRLLAVDSNSGSIVILDKNTLQRISFLSIGLRGITSALELPNGNIVAAFPNSGLVFLVNPVGVVLGPIISGVPRPFGLSRNKERVYITGLGGFVPQIHGNPIFPCNGVLATIKISSLLSFTPGPPLGATIIKSGLCKPEGVLALSTKIAVVETGKNLASLYDEEGILLGLITNELEINNVPDSTVHFSGIASNGRDFFFSYNLNKPGIEVFRRKLINGCDPTDYRSYDGSCNNLKNPDLGKAKSFFNRGAEGHQYTDGKQEMVDRGNARTISNKFFAGPENIFNDHDINLLEVFFGQFVNHDIESNADITDPDDPFANLFKYAKLEPTDRLWRPTLDSLRVTNSSGKLVNGVFEVYNNQTAFLDLSTIYGNSEDMANRLRTHTGGRLLTSNYTFTPLFPPGSASITYTDLPPKRTLTGLKILPALLTMNNDQIFTSGDHRVHENIILSLMHTIWIREHNKNADNIARSHPLWSDERVYQEARRITIAEYQHIVIEEYLPAVLRENLEEYRDYKENLNPNTLYSFASAAFRYGHSTLNSFIAYDQCFDPIQIAQGPPPPGSFIPPLAPKLPFLGQIGGVIPPVQVLDFIKGPQNLIRSLIVARSGKSENIYTDDVRNIDLSFGGINTGGAGIDLGAFDIFRARNNGVPNYYRLRTIYYDLKNPNGGKIYGKNGCDSTETSTGKDQIECFLQITSNQTLAAELRDFFNKINNIDPVLGLLAENIEQGKQLSNTLANIIRTEYDTKRKADRFWYENDQFNFATIQRIKSTSFGSVIKRTIGNLNSLPDNVFHVPANYADSLKAPTCGQVALPPCDFVTLFPPNCQVPIALPACPVDGSIVPPNCNYICSNPPAPTDNPTCKPRCVPPALVTNCHFVASK